MYHIFFIHQLMDIWVVSIFCLCCFEYVCTDFCVDICSFLLAIYSWLWNCWVMLELCLACWGTARLFVESSYLPHFIFPPHLHQQQKITFFDYSYPSECEVVHLPALILKFSSPWSFWGMESSSNLRVGQLCFPSLYKYHQIRLGV